ncbi:hypothetical protein [uncultured Rothia sp.]|mgnify:FL=1|uniref:hypothetical protein n=1 Tax=uncultured Rothia sp. TaxID=316088 RepID=UPI0032162B00
MADTQNVENIEKSITEWQTRLADGSSPVPQQVGEEIINKLKVDLEEAKNS